MEARKVRPSVCNFTISDRIDKCHLILNGVSAHRKKEHWEVFMGSSIFKQHFVSKLFFGFLIAGSIAHAELSTSEALTELRVEAETVTSESQADVDEAKISRDLLIQTQERHRTEMASLRKQIQSAQIASAKAIQDRARNEREIARLQSLKTQEEMRLKKAQIINSQSQSQLARTDSQRSKIATKVSALQAKKESVLVSIQSKREKIISNNSEIKRLSEEIKKTQLEYKRAIQRNQKLKLALAQQKDVIRKKSRDLKTENQRLRSVEANTRTVSRKG